MTTKEFNSKYLVSKGHHPQSDYDNVIEVATYIVSKNDFDGSFKNVLSSIDSEYDEVLDVQSTIFSRFRRRYNVSSEYDCTGELYRYSREVRVLHTNNDWVILVTNTFGYDY
jgi:hypothetical protein